MRKRMSVLQKKAQYTMPKNTVPKKNPNDVESNTVKVEWHASAGSLAKTKMLMHKLQAKRE